MVCGALGSYDRARVLKLAELMDGRPRPVHEDRDSVLMLDREPIRWQGRTQRGLGWIEGAVWQGGPGVRDWREAARQGGCGLAIDGRRRFLHTAVNGLAPLYWIEDRGATYFASRIEPLVRSSPSLLSIDWDAWASIVTLRYPLGQRTPFAEVRRLGPFSTLRRRFGRTRTDSPTWPWAEIEENADLAGATEATVEALRGALRPLPGGLLCPLSGGRDSRMLFLALAGDGRVAGALTVSDDEGDSYEEDLAAAVAAALGVSHARLAGEAADYPADWAERALRVEYQFADHAWLMPLARRLDGVGTPVPDGFGIDVFFCAGRHFYNSETLDSSDGRKAGQAMFDSLRRYGLAQQALAEGFRGPVVARAREQFRAATRHLEGHRSQAILSLYATRSVRGVSGYPNGLLGGRATVIAPGASDPVVVAALSASPAAKLGGNLYSGVFELLCTPAAGLPSTADQPRRQPHLPRRWRSRFAREAHRSSLADGPLAAHLSPELHAWLNGPDEIDPSPDLRLGIESISMLHAWWRRYRDHLRPLDAADLRS